MYCKMYIAVYSLRAHLMKTTSVCSCHQYNEPLQNINIVLLWFDIKSKGLLPFTLSKQHLTKRHVPKNEKNENSLGS